MKNTTIKILERLINNIVNLKVNGVVKLGKNIIKIVKIFNQMFFSSKS